MLMCLRATCVLSLSMFLVAKPHDELCDVSFGDLETLPEGWAKDASLARASARACAMKTPSGASVVRSTAPPGASGARLSYGHAASTMALTWEMPNTTSASYVPIVELTAKGGLPSFITGFVV